MSRKVQQTTLDEDPPLSNMSIMSFVQPSYEIEASNAFAVASGNDTSKRRNRNTNPSGCRYPR